MKRLKFVVVTLLTLSLTGCIQKYNLTEQQSDSAAEYMAALLLQHDENYKSDLLPMEVVESNGTGNDKITVTPAPTAGPSEGNVNTEDNQTSEDTINKDKGYTLTEVIGESDFEIQYLDYQIADAYTENPYFSITPREGNQLMIISFEAKNTSDHKAALNLIEKALIFQLDINVGTMYQPLLTLLENDLHNINITIGKGRRETMLLIFEISKETDISNMNLIVSNDNKSEIIEIK